MHPFKIIFNTGSDYHYFRKLTEIPVGIFIIIIDNPPDVRSNINFIVFCATQKEGDQQITSQVGGKLTTYTQTGLAAGQEYTVTIKGEINKRMGTESTVEFTTRESGNHILYPLINICYFGYRYKC